MAKLGAGRDLLNAIEKDLVSKDATETKVAKKTWKKRLVSLSPFFGGFLCLGFFRISSRHPRRGRTFWQVQTPHRATAWTTLFAVLGL